MYRNEDGPASFPQKAYNHQHGVPRIPPPPLKVTQPDLVKEGSRCYGVLVYRKNLVRVRCFRLICGRAVLRNGHDVESFLGITKPLFAVIASACPKVFSSSDGELVDCDGVLDLVFEEGVRGGGIHEKNEARRMP